MAADMDGTLIGHLAGTLRMQTGCWRVSFRDFFATTCSYVLNTIPRSGTKGLVKVPQRPTVPNFRGSSVYLVIGREISIQGAEKWPSYVSSAFEVEHYSG